MKTLEINKDTLEEYLSSNDFDENMDIEDTGLERARNYFILLYPDTNSYDFENALRILKSYKYYAYIKHKPEKEEKKEHVHFFLHLDNALTIQSLSNKTGIPDRFFKVPRSIRSVNRYLIHIDDEDKIQYNIEDVVVSKNWKRNFEKCFDDVQTEEEIICSIYNAIDDMVIQNGTHCPISTISKTLMLWTYQNCFDTVYRKYRKEFYDYIYYKLDHDSNLFYNRVR